MNHLNDKNEYLEVMTTFEVAKFLKITRKTVSIMASQGRIPAKKVGSEWRFLKTKLEEWLSDDYSKPEQKPVDTLRNKENAPCHFLNVAKHTGSISGSKEKEYDELLGL